VRNQMLSELQVAGSGLLIFQCKDTHYAVIFKHTIGTN